ncbi:hypothetical protein [Chryseobacterium sp.]|uniref:hypothetical protein n=1 Tax=Chryseobacterium sp. TaxID=1871047 RepID=UPI003FA5E3F5
MATIQEKLCIPMALKLLIIWLILAIKSTIEPYIATMNLLMATITSMTLKTFGGLCNSSSPSLEAYTKKRFICISKNVNLDIIVEIQIFT